MPSQQQIERFTLAFHRAAVARLREEPALRERALEVIDRWEAQGVSAHAQTYRDRWRALLQGNISSLEEAVCAATDEAATLRSMSPLGFVLRPEVRQQLREQAMSP